MEGFTGRGLPVAESAFPAPVPHWKTPFTNTEAWDGNTEVEETAIREMIQSWALGTVMVTVAFPSASATAV